MQWLGHKTWWLVLIASLAFNGGVGATHGLRAYRQHCERGQHDERGPAGWRGSCGRLTERLGLTPEQAEQFESAWQAFKTEARTLRSQLHDADDTLADLIAAPNPDEQAIDASLVEIAGLREQMQRGVVDHFLALKQLLDAEQQENFNKMIRHRLRSYDRHSRDFGGQPGHKGWSKGDPNDPDRERRRRGRHHRKPSGTTPQDDES
ncbi:MAG: periplasmic heavy metal sensor [Planctomycetes bacterium]|nr:periplasmic heavy metal sensor [Planctomycetota bacterium]